MKAQKATATKRGHGLKQRLRFDMQPIDRVVVGLDRGKMAELEYACRGHDPVLPYVRDHPYPSLSWACCRVRQTTKSDLRTSLLFLERSWRPSVPRFPQVSRPERDGAWRSYRWFPAIQSYLPCASPFVKLTALMRGWSILLIHSKPISLSSSASRSRMGRFGFNGVAGASTTVSWGASVVSGKSRNLMRRTVGCSIGSVAPW